MNIKKIKEHLKLKHDEFISSLFNEETKHLIKEKTFFAGGAIRDLMRNKRPKDYDLFFVDNESVEQFKKLVKKEYSLSKTKIGNYNSSNTQVQVVTIVSGNPDDVVDCFDFTINQGYYVPQMDLLKKGDSSDKLEVCENITSPLQALLRVDKFRLQGYDCPLDTLVQLGVAISKMGAIDTPEKLEDALKGVSTSIVLEGYPQVEHSPNPWESFDIPF